MADKDKKVSRISERVRKRKYQKPRIIRVERPRRDDKAGPMWISP